ncbi:MAG TPA: PH domain-containing protein, partial [Dehalococcoidia bacterium]|nr:PH domain-containing protein [Dehalococcoidia bacterium]
MPRPAVLRIEPRAGPRRTYRPPRAKGILTGLALTLAGLALTVASVVTFEQRYPDPSAVLFAGIAVGAGFSTAAAAALTTALAGLTYSVRDVHLDIGWWGARLRVPLGDISEVVPDVEAGPLTRWRGLTWWGYAVGHGWSENLGRVVVIGTDGVAHRWIFVRTSTVAFGLTIDPTSSFADSLTRRPLRPAPESPRAEVAPWRALAIWSDGAFWGATLLGGLGVLVAWGLALGHRGLFEEGAVYYLGSIRVDRAEDLQSLVLVGACLWAAGQQVGRP